MDKTPSPAAAESHVSAGQDALWCPKLIDKYDLSGPRYTSYPTAPQFHTGFTERDWQQAIARSNVSQRPLSLYIHIPFCDTVCYYCGCNKVITKNRDRAIPYLDALYKEIKLQSATIDNKRPVQQVHFGGGTPTYLSDQQLKDLLAQCRSHFSFANENSLECSIEIHPQTVTPNRLSTLREMGFNRLSLGVQDFNDDVQKAVNRFNSAEEVQALITRARECRFTSISMDLIYGLPKQTIASFDETLAQVIAMRPDRLSLFSYAHMPHLFKVQKQIQEETLPSAQDKLTILHHSIQKLTAAGYIYIGMDHFALPNDELAIAQQQGLLHRNFQGYTTGANCDLLGFGVSAISAVDNTQSQNHKHLDDYVAALKQDQLAIARGVTLSQEDLIRRDVIMTLICQFQLTFSDFEQKWHRPFQTAFAKELDLLAPLAKDGLLAIDDKEICVHPEGRLLIRRICMEFDAYLQTQRVNVHASDIKYSKII